MNTINTPQIPLPVGAVDVHEWRDDGDGEGLCRYFRGSSWVVEQTRIAIAGFQHRDGSVVRHIALAEQDVPEILTPAQARQLARALFTAADEAERMQAADDEEVTR
jgi:hypothetical protein